MCKMSIKRNECVRESMCCCLATITLRHENSHLAWSGFLLVGLSDDNLSSCCCSSLTCFLKHHMYNVPDLI